MTDIGEVVSIDGGKAKIKVDKKDECSKCGMCLFPENAKSLEFDADNEIDAKIGDKVLFTIKDDMKLLSILLVFLVPLLLIGVSLLISFLVIKKEIWGLILSLIFIVAWYIILSPIDNKLKKQKKFCPEIIKVVSGKEKDE